MDLGPSGLDERLLSFIAERFPFALDLVTRAVANCGDGEAPPAGPDAIRRHGDAVCAALTAIIATPVVEPRPETTPGVSAGQRRAAACDELLRGVADFYERESIAASLTHDERREILRGMVLTRAVDNRLKRFFTNGEVQFRNVPFQGKGFRSLGQEAVYAAAIRLRRGARHRGTGGQWGGDVVGPLIRDVGVALAMRPEAATVRMVLNAQMAKSGPPMDGRDLHIGDFAWGILPATAPLSISSLTLAGMALAFARGNTGQVAVSFIGDGGASLGEWHEAINAAAAQRLPMIFCIENNQIALSTQVSVNSAARVFADKASGYGIPGVTIDGTDPDAIAAAFSWAAERARAGHGPALLELVCMRMCGHAHHDDMLYLGQDPRPGWEYPALSSQAGYVDQDRYHFWASRDPIASYAARLTAAGTLADGDLDRLRGEAETMVDAAAQSVIAAPWPSPDDALHRTRTGPARPYAVAIRWTAQTSRPPVRAHVQ